MQLQTLFRQERWDSERMARRGPPLPLHVIPKDNRYLISEMACKCYGPTPKEGGDMERALLEAFEDHKKRIGGKVTIKKLIEGSYAERQGEFLFSADDVLEEAVSSADELRKKMGHIAAKVQRSPTQGAREHQKLFVTGN
jgi:hypothetical protein